MLGVDCKIVRIDVQIDVLRGLFRSLVAVLLRTQQFQPPFLLLVSGL